MGLFSILKRKSSATFREGRSYKIIPILGFECYLHIFFGQVWTSRSSKVKKRRASVRQDCSSIKKKKKKKKKKKALLGSIIVNLTDEDLKVFIGDGKCEAQILLLLSKSAQVIADNLSSHCTSSSSTSVL